MRDVGQGELRDFDVQASIAVSIADELEQVVGELSRSDGTSRPGLRTRCSRTSFFNRRDARR